MIFVLFWVLGAEGTIGSEEILENISTEKRIITLIVLSIYLLFLYFFYIKGTNFINYLVAKLPSKFQENIWLKNIFKLLIIVIIIDLLEIIEGIVIILIVKEINKKKDTSKIIIFLYQIILIFLVWFFVFISFNHLTVDRDIIESSFETSIFFIIVILSIKKIGWGINLMIYGILLLIFVNINDTDLYLFGLFLIILPLTNSLLDYISLKISLYMARQILIDKSIIKVFLHLLADIMVAIILLLGLAIFLHYSIELLNLYTTENIEIDKMLLSAYHDPFSIKNGWITFMLLSTLVPTSVHLVIAMGALLTEIFPAQKSLEKLQAYKKGEEAMLESSAHYFTRILFLQLLFSFAIVGAIVYLIWYLV